MVGAVPELQKVVLAHICKDQAAEEAKCWCRATCFLCDLLPHPDVPLFQSKDPVRGWFCPNSWWTFLPQLCLSGNVLIGATLSLGPCRSEWPSVSPGSVVTFRASGCPEPCLAPWCYDCAEVWDLYHHQRSHRSPGFGPQPETLMVSSSHLATRTIPTWVAIPST